MEYYSILNRDEVLIPATRMNLENRLHELSRTQKDKLYHSTFRKQVEQRNSQSQKIDYRLPDPGLRRDRVGSYCLMEREFLFGVMKRDTVTVAQPCACK